MSDLNMDAADHPLDLSRVPPKFINEMLQSISLIERFTCALVCKAWAQEAAAATRSIILRDRNQDLSCLQRWLENHGGQVEVLQLEQGGYAQAVLTALPCPQLQDLLVGNISLDSKVWSDIAAATKLKYVSLETVQTASQQADIVSALTALPDLERLTWYQVEFWGQWGLTDSMLLHKLTKLTALKFGPVGVADVLEHLSLLTRLQDLGLYIVTENWAEAGCPGLQELKALTRLELLYGFDEIPASVSQLTALQQLDIASTTQTSITRLQPLTGLTQLCVEDLKVDTWPESPPLQLPGLQHLELRGLAGTMPMSFLACCTQLQVLKLIHLDLSGPGSLVATGSSMLQHLELRHCRVSAAADGFANPVSWQQVFSGPGQLPHLTSLKMVYLQPDLQDADMECVVSTCSSLQVLQLGTPQDSVTSALTRLSGLTCLTLARASDQQCSSLAQLTGLRELRVMGGRKVFAAGLRQVAALEQLTSLELNSLGWSSAVLKEHMSDRLPGPRTYEYGIINKAPAGQPPDVSARLRQACDMATAADS